MGRKFADAQESRELGNVDLRLEHMDETGVDVQVLHNTMFIESATDRAAVEVALCKLEPLVGGHLGAGKGSFALVLHGADIEHTGRAGPDSLRQRKWRLRRADAPRRGQPLARRLVLLSDLRGVRRLDMAIAIHIANGNAWLCDLYRHPVGVASTLHRFRVPTVAAFNDIVLSEIPQPSVSSAGASSRPAPSGCPG